MNHKFEIRRQISEYSYYIILLIIFQISCGFAIDPLTTDNFIEVEVEGPTKYKKLIVGPCSFRIDVEATIPDDWGHWKENLQQFAVISKHARQLERARYSLWNDLHTSVECGFCKYGLNGLISVVDSKDDLVPWGCGVERPPLDIQQVTSTFVSREGTTPINKEDVAPWDDDPLKGFKHIFVPELIDGGPICEGEAVMLNLDEACEVLVEAGVMERISN